MSFEERNDFFVERKEMTLQKTNDIIHVICALIKDNDINTEVRDYMPSKDYRTGSNYSRVRIPSILFLRDKVEELTDFSKVFKIYRKQLGTHLFVDYEGKLGVINCYLDQNNRYRVSTARFINEVYPCFTKVGEDSHLCIGLRFTRNLKEGIRSFGRITDNQNPSGGVFDLMENFLDPQRIKTGIESSANRTLFHKGEQHFAIYVCSGAKLIVEDERYDLLKQNPQIGIHRNRSLFQSGSLVIFSCDLLLELSVAIKDDKLDSKQVKKVVFEWKKVDKLNVLKPEDNLYQNWFTHRGLHQSNEQVIFLGYNYSVHNSICWRLKIGTPFKKKGMPFYARLSVPENGRIVDIQDWDWGMAEIYWRHRYERLYEKVLFNAREESYVQKPHFSFQIPDIGGKNPKYWQKKILGVGVNFNSWKVKYKYKYEDQSLAIIPPYNENYITLIESIIPFPQPLHPPIYSDSKYNYLPYKTCPQYKEQQLIQISGEDYQISYKEDVDEYVWTDPKRVTLDSFNNLSADKRLGVDLMVYTKQNSVIGKKVLIYFQLISNEDKDSKNNQKSSENLSKEKSDDSPPKKESTEKASEQKSDENISKKSSDNSKDNSKKTPNKSEENNKQNNTEKSADKKENLSSEKSEEKPSNDS